MNHHALPSPEQPCVHILRVDDTREVPMDTSVERNLLRALLDRLGQRARAAGGALPYQANEAAMRLVEADRLLEQCHDEHGLRLFQGPTPVAQAG